MKKILTSFICILTVICLLCGSMTAFAEADWGTPEEGIVPTRANLALYHEPYLESNGFPNFNFDQGFKYWTSSYLSASHAYKPTEAAKLTKEGDNTYIVLTPTQPYDNIHTVQFVDSRIKVDDTLVVMYDWRNSAGEPCLQITLNQYFRDSANKTPINNGARLSDCGNGGITDLKVALNDDEWNTSMGRVYQPVQKSTGADEKIYLSVGIESTTEFTENGTNVDNIRIAKFIKSTGDVLDLDNNKLFNIHDLDIGGDAKDEITEDDFGDIDYSAENEEITKQDKTEDKAEEKSFIQKHLVWIIVGGGVLLIIVAAAVVIIIISAKKKKATNKVEPNEESDGESIENAEE